MRLTQEVDYALRIAYLLAEKGQILGAGEISSSVGVTERFTLKILRKLMIGGIVTSKKGSHGGYILSASPAEISLLQVIETIEGKLEISRCLDSQYECTRMGNQKSGCIFHLIFNKLNKNFVECFDGITLKDVVGDNINIEKILSRI